MPTERRTRMTREMCGIAVIVLILFSALPQSSTAQSDFDHFTTGFRLEGNHRFADCESCHADGLFAGTPTNCSGCHTQASRINATSKPPVHSTTSDRCDSCHRPNAWAAVTRVDHLEVFGTCSSCHNGREADGKPVDHLPTSNECDDCHRTTAWTPAAFDHNGIVSGCFSCHNGMVATGKPVTHIPATNVCEDCHNTITFAPVARVDHLQVLGTCSTCHNGVVANGKPPQHVQTTAECDGCHTTIAWQ